MSGVHSGTPILTSAIPIPATPNHYCLTLNGNVSRCRFHGGKAAMKSFCNVNETVFTAAFFADFFYVTLTLMLLS